VLRYYKLDLPGWRDDAFTIRAEVVEIRRKPSYPIGELTIDAFGKSPVFEDRGIRTRLLLAVGRRDFGSPDFLEPRDPRLHVVGASSDHLICEADEPCDDLRYGSVLQLDPIYGGMLFSSEDPDVEIDYL
jgi:predicted amino acid racemase